MIQTLTRDPAACLIAYLSLVVLTFVANLRGLISWLAWPVCNEENRHKEKRDSEDTDEYWRIHRYTGEKRSPSIDLFSQMILAVGLLIDDFYAILRLEVKKEAACGFGEIGDNCDLTSPRKGLAEFEVALTNP